MRLTLRKLWQVMALSGKWWEVVMLKPNGDFLKPFRTFLKFVMVTREGGQANM